MSAFEFQTATRVVFGPGTLAQVPGIVASLAAAEVTSAGPGVQGRASADVLVVVGPRGTHAEALTSGLSGVGLRVVTTRVAGEPTLDDVRDGARLGREAGVAVVCAIGGGSAIDGGKAIAAVLGTGLDPLEHLEVIGGARPLEQKPRPFVAIPTTAGTGAEVTRNAVLTSPEHGVKASMRSPWMLPAVALVDPEMLASLPKPVLAASGLDALSQLIEPYVSLRAQPLTDALAREGMTRSARALRRAYEHGIGGPEAAGVREDLALASLFGGLALANAGLGVVHGFAAPLGGSLKAAHGVLCACLLPASVTVNVQALRRRDPHNPALARYAEIAKLLTGDPKADIDDGVAWLRELTSALSIPGLAALGLSAGDVAETVRRGRQASSMKGNPLVLTDEELRSILEASM